MAFNTTTPKNPKRPGPFYPGVQTIQDYLKSLPYRPFNKGNSIGNCAPGHFYQVDNEYPYSNHLASVIVIGILVIHLVEMSRCTVTNAIAFVKWPIGQRLEIVLDRLYSRVKGSRPFGIFWGGCIKSHGGSEGAAIRPLALPWGGEVICVCFIMSAEGTKVWAIRPPPYCRNPLQFRLGMLLGSPPEPAGCRLHTP